MDNDKTPADGYNLNEAILEELRISEQARHESQVRLNAEFVKDDSKEVLEARRRFQSDFQLKLLRAYEPYCAFWRFVFYPVLKLMDWFPANDGMRKFLLNNKPHLTLV
jgi:hypothetical protein